MLQIWIIGKESSWSGDDNETYDNASNDAGRMDEPAAAGSYRISKIYTRTFPYLIIGYRNSLTVQELTAIVQA